MTGDEKPTAKGEPGGTDRKRTPLPEDIEETLAGVSHDREITIVDPVWPARDRDAEIQFTSGNMTNAQGVTEADMQRLADALAERGVFPSLVCCRGGKPALVSHGYHADGNRCRHRSEPDGG